MAWRGHGCERAQLKFCCHYVVVRTLVGQRYKPSRYPPSSENSLLKAPLCGARKPDK
jgi:hypothetical protein